MDYEKIKECTDLSEQEKIAFPEVVARLDQAQVELYRADLLNPKKIYYGQNQVIEIASKFNSEEKVNDLFNAEQVIQAIRASQSGRIKYQEFIQKIKDAGVITYFVFIQGKRALYLGRKGEQHLELFPNQ